MINCTKPEELEGSFICMMDKKESVLDMMLQLIQRRMLSSELIESMDGLT